VLIDNAGSFGAFFGDTNAGPNERAMAEIFRLNVPPPTTAGVAQRIGAAAPAGGGMRIGLAGFRDDPAGMVVMVDVGALAPGNYSVGISDPSVMGGLSGTGNVTPNPSIQSPQSRAAPIPKTVLAQVVPNQQVDGAGPGAPTATPGAAVPPVQPPVPTQSGTGVDQTNTGPGSGTGVNGATLNVIGTLTADQNGTGRMQQTVEGVQVRNVVGQAIVLYSQGGTQQTLPANLNGGTGPAGRQQVVIDSSSARGSQGVGGGAQTGGVPPVAAAGQTAIGAKLPVAAGIIRLISDRRPPATDGDTTGSSARVNSGIEQPANATPATGQNIVR
jgi:hypothetical protein